MIKKFNQYNESLRDKMTGPSEQDVNRGIDNIIFDLKLKVDSNSSDIIAEELLDILNAIYGNKKELLNDLMDNGLQASEVLFTIIDDLNTAKNDSELNYRKRILKIMFDLIVKNKDKINPEDLI